MSPFYSDNQRRFFFAVIAPMMDFGGNLFTNHLIDPIAEKLGWEEVTQKEQIDKLREAIKDSSYLKFFNEDEVGKIKEVDLNKVLKSKLTDLLVDGLKNSELASYVSDAADFLLTKKEREAIVNANFSSKYGKRNRKGKNEFHAGNDIGMLGKRGIDAPTPVEGVVIFSGCYGGYGNTVEIIGTDNNIRRFAHLKKSYVKPGDEIKAGDFVGEIGNSTGKNKQSGAIHLHYEKRQNYLFHLDGNKKTEMTYEDFKLFGPKTISKLTDNVKTAKFRKSFVDSAKRHDVKKELKAEKHPQSLDPKKESLKIVDAILEHERTKAVVKKLVNTYSKEKPVAEKSKTTKTDKKSSKSVSKTSKKARVKK